MTADVLRYAVRREDPLDRFGCIHRLEPRQLPNEETVQLVIILVKSPT